MVLLENTWLRHKHSFLFGEGYRWGGVTRRNGTVVVVVLVNE